MANGFDAYHQWLGIAPKDQPPNHYRLLGVDLFESDPDVIESAADRQMSHVRSFQSGPHGDVSQKLLNEITAAKLCLLNAAKRAEYDAFTEERLTARLVKEGGYYLVDFGDGKIDRLKLGTALQAEHFNPRAALAAGQKPEQTGRGVRESAP